MNIPYVSQSRINLYNDCPYAYYLRYCCENQFTKQHIIPLENGNAVHESIEEALLRYGATGVWEVDYLIKQYVKNAVKHGLKQNIIKEMSEQLRAWAKHYVPPPNIVGIEQRFEAEIDGIPVVAIMDMIEIDDTGCAVIHDWKTNIRPYDAETLGNDIQAPLYLKLLKLMYPGKAGYKFFFEFVRSGITMEYEYDDAKIDDAWEYIKLAYQTIKEDEEPSPRPCRNCATCPGIIHEVCPAVKSVREHGLDYCIESLQKSLRNGSGFVDDSDISKLLLERKSIKGMKDIVSAMETTINKKLMVYLESNDASSDIVAGHKIAIVSRTDTKYSPFAIIKALEKNPEKLKKALDVRKGIVDKYIKDGSIGKMMGAEIEKTATKKSSASYIMVKKTSEKREVNDDDEGDW